MSQDSELARLEAFVEKLLTKYDQLRAENASLKAKIASKEQSILELNNTLTNKEDERGEISSRVNKLLRQIEDWEDSLVPEEVADAEADAAEAEVEEDEEPAAEILEEVEDEFAEPVTTEVELEKKVKPEEEGRVQHNLFSMSANR